MGAAKIIGILIFWAVIGIIWATLNDNIMAQIPTMFPQPVTEDAETYSLMQFFWTLSPVIVAIGTASSVLGGRGLSGVIGGAVILFTSIFMLTFIWAAFWTPVNITIPDAFAAGFGATTNQKENLAVYDTSFLLAVVLFSLIILLVGGDAQIGRGKKIRAGTVKVTGKRSSISEERLGRGLGRVARYGRPRERSIDFEAGQYSGYERYQ